MLVLKHRGTNPSSLLTRLAAVKSLHPRCCRYWNSSRQAVKRKKKHPNSRVRVTTRQHKVEEFMTTNNNNARRAMYDLKM